MLDYKYYRKETGNRDSLSKHQLEVYYRTSTWYTVKIKR